MPPMLLDLLYIVVGIFLLAYSGNKLVDFASALGVKARLTPAVIGLTIVAAGTSFPELFVSLMAAFKGSSDIAIANVVGSNISNIGLVLGFCAILGRVDIGPRILKLDYPFLLIVSWISLLLCRDGLLDRLESGFFLGSLVLFTSYSIWISKRDVDQSDQEKLNQRLPDQAKSLQKKSLGIIILGLLLGFLGLMIGARVLVLGAINIAKTFGMTQRVIGLTVVAMGTSLPELVTSGIATYKKQYDLAITNIIGSNILNLLLILGFTGIIRPIHVVAKISSFDMWIMMFFTILLLPMIFWDRRLSRGEGLVFLAFITLYTTYLLYT